MAKSRAQKRAEKSKERKAAQKPAQARPRPRAPAPKDEPLDEARARELGYDANRDPEPEAWRAIEERDRLSRVARFHHETLPEKRLPPSMQRHAAMHVIVESQLVDGTPREARAALARLIGEGMSRHEALHALGWVATEHMRRAVEEQRPVDDRAYAADLAALTVRSWLRMAGLQV